MDTTYQDSFVIRRAEWKRRLKAFVIASSASFLLLNLIWSISTSQYLAKNRIGLGKIEVGNSAADQQEAIEKVVAQAWEQGTTHEAIRDHLLRMKGLDPRDESNPELDTQRVQDAISYQLVKTNGSFQLQLSLEGTGSVIERRLIDRIGIKMASRLAILPIENMMVAQEKFAKEPSLMGQLAQRLKTPISALQGATRQAEDLASRLGSLQTNRSRETQAESLQQQQAAMVVATLKNQLSDLQYRQNQLESRKRELNGLPESEPRNQVIIRELLQVADDRERVENQLAIEQSKVRSSSPFRNASFSKSSSLADPVTELPGGETLTREQATQLAQTLGQLDQEMVRLQSQVNEQARQSKDLGMSSVPVFVSSFEKARVVPRNGVHFLGPFLLLCMVSGLVGSVIAWKYKPLVEDVGFDNRQQILDLLRVPIVAELKQADADEPVQRPELPWSNVCVKASELIVLTALAMIACMMLFSPSIRASFAENPMHGLSEIMWKIQGK